MVIGTTRQSSLSGSLRNLNFCYNRLDMAIDWTKIYQKYKGKWVALKADEKTVVGFGKTAKLALLQAKKSGYQDPILHRVPAVNRLYVGFLSR